MILSSIPESPLSAKKRRNIIKWFKHDSNANTDAKLRRVRLKYGMEGYGLYWYCLELIAQNIEKHNLTFELEHDAEIISADTNIHHERVNEIMAYFVDIGLFENTSGIITCLKMSARTDEYTQKLMKSISNVPTLSRHTPDKVRSNRTEQNRTEYNKIKKKSKSFAPPSLDEVTQYCKQRANAVDPETFVDFYSSKGWMVGKTKMKDWQACVRTWEKRETAEKKSVMDWDKLAQDNARPGESMAEFKQRWLRK